MIIRKKQKNPLSTQYCFLIFKYTLSEGATMSHQIFIKPDKIPSGYMSACLEQSKTTHEIPLKDFAEATDNYHQIYHQLKSFLIPTVLNKTRDLSEDDRTRRRYLRLTQPCVFFPAVEYEQTSRILEWLQEKVEGLNLKSILKSLLFPFDRNETKQRNTFS